MKARQVLICVIIVVISFLLGMICGYYRCSTDSPLTELGTDTVYMTRVDTVKDFEIKHQFEKLVDTLYIPIENKCTIYTNNDKPSITLPITQKYYSSENYKAWVSGYMPKLDSIYTFNTHTKETIEREITVSTTDVFMDFGCFLINNTYAPNVGLSVSLKDKWLFGGNIGIMDDNVYYGMKLGVKIN